MDALNDELVAFSFPNQKLKRRYNEKITKPCD